MQTGVGQLEEPDLGSTTPALCCRHAGKLACAVHLIRCEFLQLVPPSSVSLKPYDGSRARFLHAWSPRCTPLTAAVCCLCGAVHLDPDTTFVMPAPDRPQVKEQVDMFSYSRSSKMALSRDGQQVCLHTYHVDPQEMRAFVEEQEALSPSTFGEVPYLLDFHLPIQAHNPRCLLLAGSLASLMQSRARFREWRVRVAGSRTGESVTSLQSLGPSETASSSTLTCNGLPISQWSTPSHCPA